MLCYVWLFIGWFALAKLPAALPCQVVTLSSGFENGQLVRNHTTVHYFHCGGNLVDGIITVDQVIEPPTFSHPDAYVCQDTLAAFRGILRKGKKHGTFLSLPEANVFYVETFAKDVKHGAYRGFYTSGRLFCEGFYQHGELQGLYREYYANGKPAILKRISKEVERLMYAEDFYLNGKLHAKGTYYRDRKVNEWQYYTYDGVLEKTEYYNSRGVLLKTKPADA